MPYNLKHMYGSWRTCPTCGKDFFVTHPDEYAYRRYKSRSHGTPFGHKDAHFWNGNGIMDKYVTHWMPLPQPPREETK